MTPEAWQAISAIVGTFGAATSAVAVALITSQRGQVRRSADAAEAARDEASAAKTNTVPISDGFARRTTETLAELSRRSEAHEARLTWLTDALGQHLTMHGATAPPPPWRSGTIGCQPPDRTTCEDGPESATPRTYEAGDRV